MKIKPDRIYFDMDGVLADFSKGVRILCGIEPAPQGNDWVPGCDETMWEKIRMQDHFYDRLEIMPGAREMFDMIYKKYGARCEILTAVPKPEKGILTAEEDKIRWMRRLFPEEVVIHIVLREEKPLYCRGKGSILIDDFDENIRFWEECGGTGIHYISSEETIRQLQDIGVL